MNERKRESVYNLLIIKKSSNSETFFNFLIMLFKFKKTKFNPQHLFYIGFFILYAVFTYLFLYQLTGLQPFQINIHFFSNVVGSFSKRFISDTAPLALLLYLAYYSKKDWIQYIFIGLFILVFTVNSFTIGYYFVHRANWQLGNLTFTPFLTILAILVVILAFGIGYFAIKFKNKGDVWAFKRNLFTVMLILLTILTPFIPIAYSTHKTLVTSQKDVENTFRVFYLEKPTLTHLYQIITNTTRPLSVPDVSVFEDGFKEEIESK